MSQKNLPATRDIPAPTPQYAQSLSPEQLVEHRQKIAFEVEVILNGYWDRAPSDDIKAGVLADWSDTLEDWTLQQVVFALRDWRNNNPNITPNPGYILKLMKGLRGKKVAAQIAPPPEPAPRVPVTAEAAAEILAQFNIGSRFKSNRSGGAS